MRYRKFVVLVLSYLVLVGLFLSSTQFWFEYSYVLATIEQPKYLTTSVVTKMDYMFDGFSGYLEYDELCNSYGIMR